MVLCYTLVLKLLQAANWKLESLTSWNQTKVLTLFVLLGDLKVVHGTEEEPILLTTILWIWDQSAVLILGISFCQGQGTISQQGTNSRLNCSGLEANGKEAVRMLASTNNICNMYTQKAVYYYLLQKLARSWKQMSTVQITEVLWSS